MEEIRKNFVSDHFKWRTRPGRGQNSTAFWGGGAWGKVLLYFSGSCRSTSFDAVSSSGSGSSAGALTSIGRNVSLSHRKIGESTRELSGHSSNHCPEMSFQSLVSPNPNENQASSHPYTFHAPEAPCEVYLSTMVFSLACTSSVHSRSTRCAFCFSIRICGFPFPRLDSDYLLFVQGFAIWIIQCAESCWALWPSVLMACIKLFTAEYSASAPCFSISVSFSASSGASENSHTVWKHQS